MINRKVDFFSTVAGALVLGLCAPAVAAPSFTGTGDFGQSWTIDDTSTNNETGVSGVVYWDIFTDNGSTYFGFSIENTTSLGQPADTRITGFAWNFPVGTSAFTPVEDDSSLEWVFNYTSPKLPGEPGRFDVCTYPDQNCQSGGNTGIEVGDAFNWFYVRIDGEFDVASFADVRACLRFIAIPTTGVGSGNGAGSDVACRGDEPQFDVPEPSSLALLGLGLMGFGLARRRRS